MDDSTELKTCSLEMKGGYNSTHPYPQQFVRAPLSHHPSPAPSTGKEMPYNEAIRITMGK